MITPWHQKLFGELGKRFTMAHIKQHPDVIPVIASGIIANAMAVAYFVRHLTLDPNYCWKRRPGVEMPYDDYRNKQYKFWSAGREDFECKAPDYWPKPGENIENPYDPSNNGK